MSPACSPKRIFLIRLKVTPFRFERVKHFIECWKDDFSLCTSHFAADYIVTELKSPSRIIRNAKQSTCPVVHINWILDSLCSNKVLDPENYMIDVSAARATDVPLPSKPLPRQVKWVQLAEMRNKALEESGVVTTFRFTAAYLKRQHFAQRRKDKSNKRETKDQVKEQSIKEEQSYIKKEAISTTTTATTTITKHENAYIKQETEYTHTFIKSEALDTVKQEQVDQDCALQATLNKSCSSSSLDFEQQSSSLPEIAT